MPSWIRTLHRVFRGHRRHRRTLHWPLVLQQLEDRCLLTVAINEFGYLTANSHPFGITADPAGNFWFTESTANRIARITPSGSITEFVVPTANSQPFGIAAGRDGNLWFAERAANKIGRLTPQGIFTEFTIPTANSQPYAITRHDSNFWFTENAANKIGRITPQGVVTEFTIATANSMPAGISSGEEGQIWFTESNANKIGRISERGQIAEFVIPSANSQPFGIAAREDNVWFTESNANKIGRLSEQGRISEFAIPTANSQPFGITARDDDSVWFTESNSNKIGHIGEQGRITEFSIPTGNSQPLGIVAGRHGTFWFTESHSNLIGQLVPDARLAAVGTTLNSTEGAAFAGVVATFTADHPHADADDFTASITWGDGHTSRGMITPNGRGGFNVNGTNTYAEEGAAEIRVSVSVRHDHDHDDDDDDHGRGFTATAHSVATVADAPLVATGTTMQTANGVTFNGQVATFTDAGGPEPVASYSASIDWGDGTSPTPGTIIVAGTTFRVSGSHPYANGGTFTTRVTIRDEGGSAATAAGIASVLAVVIDSPIPGLLTKQNVTVTGHLTGAIPQVASLVAQVDSGAFASVAFDAAGNFGFTTALLLDHSADGNHTVRLRAMDRAGDASQFAAVSFRLNTVVHITEIAPANGEELVGLIRPTVVSFEAPVNPATVTTDSFYLIANGSRVPGSVRVSSTKLFATFFPTNPLPASTEVRVVVDGDKIKDSLGQAVNGNGGLIPGGKATADFRTLPLTRIRGTNLFGFVYDAYNKRPDGSNIPVVGATIRVDAFPAANAVTDATGFFMLRDMPAPEFFVHVDGTTATTAPPGTGYPSVGKAFHSVPGQTVQLNMRGTPFNIYLPPMATGDIKPLSATQSTDVGFGAGGKAELATLFPNINPAVWDRLKVGFAPRAATDNAGNPATQAAVIPVPPDRLPAPLPPGQNPKLVISIQALGATRFDVPAPLTYPNIDGLAPGTKALIWSFNHDAGRWEVIGPGTVSADGSVLNSDPGVGIKAPGWHFVAQGSLNRDVTNALTGSIDKADYKDLDKLLKEHPECFDPLSLLLGMRVLNGECLTTAAQTVSLALAYFRLKSLSTAADLLGHFLDNNGGPINYGDGSGPSQKLKNDAQFQQENNNLQTMLKQKIQAQVAAGQQNIDINLDLQSPSPLAHTFVPGDDDLKSAFGRLQGVDVTAAGDINGTVITGQMHYTYSIVYGFGSKEATRQSFAGYALSQARILQLAGLAKPFIASVSVTVPINLDLSRDPVLVTTQPTISTVPGFGSDPSVYYRFVLGSGFVVTGKTDVLGQLNNVVFPPNTAYQGTFYAPATNRWTSIRGTSGDSGQIFGLEGDPSTLYLDHFGGVDSTGDGLPDVGRYVLGLTPGVRSFAGDGISDAAKLAMGLDPLDGRAFPTGIISSLPLQGEAKKVVLVGSTLNAQGQLAYVATGSYGLAIVDASQFNNPIVLGQIQLPGSNEVAVDPSLKLAVLAAGSVLHLVDVADPMVPVLRKTISIGANHVKAADGLAYVAAGSQITVIDLATGTPLGSQTYAGGTIDDLAIADGFLYAIAHASIQPHTVNKIALGSKIQAPVASATINGHPTFGRMHIFAGGGLIYVGAADDNNSNQVPGVEILRDSGATLDLIGAPSAITAFDVAVNGSGLALFTGASAGGESSAQVGLLDVSNPTNTGRFVVGFATPGAATSVAIASGIAYVTAGSAGLQVINYLPFDSRGVPPTVTISASAGSQVLEGTTVPVRVNATDDVQVRNVELLLNGRVIRNAVSFPFNLSAIAPNITPGSTSFTLQVRATDTGGNSTLSNVITIGLMRDTTPPTISSIDPANGATVGQGLQTIAISFSKSIAASTVTTDNFQLFMAATPISIAGLRFQQDDTVLRLTTAPLQPGLYQLVVHKGGITDRPGNPLGVGDATFNFTVIQGSSLSGTIFNDANQNGVPQPGTGLAGVLVTLTGITAQGQTVTLTTFTAADGSYRFIGLQDGVYAITETPPQSFFDNVNTVGSAGGQTSPGSGRIFNIALNAGINAIGYNFGDVFFQGGS